MRAAATSPGPDVAGPATGSGSAAARTAAYRLVDAYLGGVRVIEQPGSVHALVVQAVHRGGHGGPGRGGQARTMPSGIATAALPTESIEPPNTAVRGHGLSGHLHRGGSLVVTTSSQTPRPDTVTVHVIAARDLQNLSHFSGNQIYVALSVIAFHSDRTRPQLAAGENVTWDETLTLHVHLDESCCVSF